MQRQDSIVYKAKKFAAKRKQPKSIRNALEKSAIKKWLDKREHQVLRVKCKNDVDLALNPLTPRQRTFRLQQGQCLTLRDALIVWKMADVIYEEKYEENGGPYDAHGERFYIEPKNPYTRDLIDNRALFDWIIEMIFQAASLSLIDDWLQKTILLLQSELVERIRKFQAGEIEWPRQIKEQQKERQIKEQQNRLRQMINTSELIFIAVQRGYAAAARARRALAFARKFAREGRDGPPFHIDLDTFTLPHLKREAWYFITDDYYYGGRYIDIIEEFWNYTEGNYEFVHGVETRRVRQMPDNLL